MNEKGDGNLVLKGRNKLSFFIAFIFILANLCIGTPALAGIESATSIALDRDYTGNVKGGAKYYTFQLSKDGKVKLSMNRHKSSSWYMELMNSKGNSIESFTTEYGTNASGNEEREVGLPKGTYYIKIENYQSGYDNDYKFRVNFTATDTYEKEFNNTKESANKISLNQLYKGALQNYSDDDYYTFTLPADGNVTFSMKRNQGASWYVYIYNQNGENLKTISTEYGVNAKGNEEKQIGLPKGTYYIQVDHLQNAADILYEFQVKFQASPYFEKEFNNKTESANKVSLNQVYKGALQSYSDDDHYTFTLPADGNVTFSMKRNQGASWYVYIYDKNGNYFTTFYTNYGVNAEGNAEKQIGLPKGTYYIQIDHQQNAVDVPYEFQVKFQASNYFEKEFNGDFPLANPVQLNMNYQGTLQKSGDSDFYSFSVEKRQAIRIVMPRSQGSAWYVSLYNGEKRQVENFYTEYGTNAYGNEERTYTLEKGKYYLRIVEWTSAVDTPYQFQILNRSLSLSEKQIKVTNNKGKADVVSVSGVKVNDIVKVYDKATGGKLLGTAKVIKGSQIDVSIAQIGATSGSVYVSLTQPGMAEGERTASKYAGEPTDSLQASQVKIVNNKGKADIITVSKLKQGDVVKVYDKATGGTLLATGTVKQGTEVVVNVKQIGEKAGNMHITLTRLGLSESNRSAHTFEGEPANPLQANQVKIENNKGKADSITVSGLQINDVIKVYDKATAGKLLGTVKVTKGTQAVVNVQQLGEKAGSVYVTVTKVGMKESSRTVHTFKAEITPVPTKPLQVSQVKIVNNKGKADSITVSGLQVNDVIKVYDKATGGKLLGTVKVAKGTQAVMNIQQLGEKMGSLYVTVTKSNMAESSRLKADYKAE